MAALWDDVGALITKWTCKGASPVEFLRSAPGEAPFFVATTRVGWAPRIKRALLRLGLRQHVHGTVLASLGVIAFHRHGENASPWLETVAAWARPEAAARASVLDFDKDRARGVRAAKAARRAAAASGGIAAKAKGFAAAAPLYPAVEAAVGDLESLESPLSTDWYANGRYDGFEDSYTAPPGGVGDALGELSGRLSDVALGGGGEDGEGGLLGAAGGIVDLAEFNMEEWGIVDPGLED